MKRPKAKFHWNNAFILTLNICPIDLFAKNVKTFQTIITFGLTQIQVDTIFVVHTLFGSAFLKTLSQKSHCFFFSLNLSVNRWFMHRIAKHRPDKLIEFCKRISLWFYFRSYEIQYKWQ